MPTPIFCTATNETYVLGATVVLCSALRRLSVSEKPIPVYVLDGGVKPRSWARLERSLARTGRQCRLVRLRPEMARFQGLPKDWGSSVMTYARLALPELMNESRVIYLDADMVVQADLTPLAELDLGTNIVAAAPEPAIRTLGEGGLPCADIGLSPDAPYFQAGFLVINLSAWRSERVSEGVLSYLRKWPQHAPHWDQSALNAILPGRWHTLSPGYNTSAWHAQDGVGGSSLQAPVLHFVGPNKPWLFGHDRGPAADVFYDEVKRTAWGRWRPTAYRQALKQLRYRLGMLLRK